MMLYLEFGANQTQILTVGLCRVQHKHMKKLGTITWTYTHEPYLQSVTTFTDLGYHIEAGAKYMWYNYQKTGQYGLLTQDHLNSMRRFWNYEK